MPFHKTLQNFAQKPCGMTQREIALTNSEKKE
jgi:hypothetical protein